MPLGILPSVMKSVALARCVLIASSVATPLFGEAVQARAVEGTALRRLYDMTPVSAENPVVARVDSHGIVIPASELRAYLEAKAISAPADPAPPAPADVATQALASLIDEHLLLADGYARGADRTEEIRENLAGTENILLTEALTQKEVRQKAADPSEEGVRLQSLRTALFEQAAVSISRETHAEMMAALATGGVGRIADYASIDATERAEDELSEMPASLLRKALAVCRPARNCDTQIEVTVRDFLQVYFQHALMLRPNLRSTGGMALLLQRVLAEPLMVAEARAQGLQHSHFVKEMQQFNRNLMVKTWVHERITKEAAQRLKTPELKRQLLAWYNQHREDLYTYTDESGGKKVASFEEEIDRIRNDYADAENERLTREKIAALRDEAAIDIDATVLAQSLSPKPSQSAELPSSVIAWDSEMKEYVGRGGQSAATFPYRFKNESAGHVVIHQIEPHCDCMTVQSPPLPWVIRPGEYGQFEVTVNAQGKTGSLVRTLTVQSSHGPKQLSVKFTVPAGNASAGMAKTGPAM